MPIADLDGVKLHYHDAGSGLPVLLLHGFPLASDSFRPQWEGLPAGVRIIAPDHRGFGGTPPGSGPLEMSRIAQDSLALLDHLGIERAVVGGVSMGGYAAMAVLREDAGRVRGLVLIDTQPGADDAAGKQGREETAQAVEKQGVGVLVERMLPKLLSPQASAKVRAETERLIRSASPAGAAAASRGMALRQDSKDVLARFAGPTLVVVGEKDVITPVEKAQAMADLIAGAQLAVIPGAGHLSNLEAPDEFNRIIGDFLNKLPPT